MGIQDFVTVFDQLDAAGRGFITVEQLQALHESVYLTPVQHDHLDAALLQVCGPDHGGKVKRDAFLAVLEEVSHRQSVEEEAYWDFQALDYNGSHRIKLQDALTLFQEYHGDDFSLHTWHKFLHSRLDPAAGISFDEIREWLCNPPSGEPARDRQIQEELSRLDQSHWEHFLHDYEALKVLKDGDHKDEDDQYCDDTKRHAHRKLEKWDRQGLAAMLTDDGLDAEGETVKPGRRRDAVTSGDLLDAMEMKYSVLMDLLISYMAAFAANMESEKAELAQQIRRSVAKQTRDDKIQDVESLPGSSAMLPYSMLHIMGDLHPVHQQRAAELESLRQTLEGEGKSASQINELLRKEYESSSSGPLRCGQAMTDLMQRKVSERELLLAISHGQETGAGTAWSQLCRLQRQLVILRELTNVLPAALAVGLAERPQTYQYQLYDSDRDRSELLAKERLLERQGRSLIRTTSQLPDISELQGSGGVTIRESIITELELKHHLEREALIFMLQGPESKQKKLLSQKMTGEERHTRLLALRNHHLNWKTANSGDSTPNFSILEEAVGLYWVERQTELEKVQHNVADSTVNAAVLADLQQRQEEDLARCLDDMAGKKGEGLISLLKQESRVRFQEHFNNLAFVTLGAVELSKEDQEYVDVLSEKYRAVRDQVFVFALKEKHGHGGWNNLGREGRQAELLKLRKEEKKLRGDGHLMEMASIIGSKSQALPALVTLLGDNKDYGKGTTIPVTTKPINLLADLVPRFDLEQQRLLSWLHGEEVQSGEGQGHKLRELASLEMERFSISVDGDYETGLLFLGLLERIRTVPSGRSVGDKEKQHLLAVKRVALRKWRLRQGEPYKVPAEDKTTPTPGDKVSWQRAVLRCMLRRQAVERELLLRVLQDPGFSELVEAAAGSMESEERWQRLAHLADKHQSLDFSTPDGCEDHLSIVEEAAALRVVGLRAAARTQSGRAMSEDEVSSALLTELQDLHDVELSHQLQSGVTADESGLHQKLEKEKKSKEEEHAESVMTVLTRIDGDSVITDAFINILDEKYAALRESLFLTVVLHRGGEKLSQKQRDKQLEALRKDVISLWDKGDAEQVAKMLHSDLDLEHPVMWMLGMERSKFSVQKDAAESSQPIKELIAPDKDTGMLASIKHLMQRYLEEKEFLLASLAGANGRFLTEKAKVALKSRLRREKTVTAAEEGLEFAALACGLVERQAEDLTSPQLEKDRERYSRLARHEYRLRQSGREGKQKKDGLNVNCTENREVLQDAVLSLLLKKHVEERQLLAEMLINPRFENVQREAALESDQQRRDRLATLKSKRQSSKLDSSSDNLALLQEALVVFREISRGHQGQGSSPEDDLHLNCHMMAGLLLLQNTEAEQYLSDFPTEESEEMIESQEQILEELRKNHCVNIALLVFSPELLMSEGEQVDPVVDALDGKYDALRDKLLMQALINQIGENNWLNMSERERQKRLMELKLKERQLRRDGKFDELAALLGDALNNENTLNKLMGENREEYERKLRERLEKRKRRLAEGMSEEECDRLEKEEEEAEEEEARQRKHNVLLDLQHNFDKDRDALLRQLQEGDNSERERQKKMLQLRLQQRRLRRDDDIHSTALLLQQHDQTMKDKDSERRRQEQLAKERLEAARLRKKEGRSQGDNDAQLDVIANDLETEEDTLTLQEMALTSLDLKHQSERDLLISLLDGHQSGQHADASQGMTVEELSSKLAELGEMFQQWNSENHTKQHEGTLELLKEGLAYALELKRQQLTSEGKSASETDLQVALLADLQQIQDKECSDTMNAVTDMDNDRLKQLVRSIIKDKESGCNNNVAKTLLQSVTSLDELDGMEDADEEDLTEEEKQEKRVVKALEMKYDAMRDKLIIEALIKQYGEAEWKRMTELERQRKLVEMKRKERQLRHEGKLDEVDALLGQHLKHKQESKPRGRTLDLDAMIGESKQDQKRRLEERLARRKQLKAQREAEGLDVDDATLDSIQEEEEEQETAKRRNVLENLQMHFEDEKAALLAGLHSHADAAERERERQRALVKLQRDKQLLQQEGKLDSAALIWSMGQQQHADQQDSLLKERDRQRQLARERLMERRRQIVEGKGGDVDLQPIVEEEDSEVGLGDGVQQLLEGTLLALDKHQAAERDTLLQLLARCRRDKEGTKSIRAMSDEDLRLKLTRAEKEHASWKKESAKKVAALSDPHLTAKRRNKLTQKARQRWQSQMEILGQALSYKLELERRLLEKERQGAREDELWEEMCVITLADLQERQMLLFNSFQESVFTKSKDDLQTLRKAQRAANREGWFESLSSLTFSVEDMTGEGTSLLDRRAAEAKLQEEFMQQKQAILEKAKKDGVDADAMLRDLEAQHAAKKQALKTDMERQRNEVMQRLEARRRRQSISDYDTAAAIQMLKKAESLSQAAQNKATAEHTSQKSLLQERLQKRREARKKAAMATRDEEMRAVSSPLPSFDGVPRSDSSLGMRREKSLIQQSVTEDEKQAIYNQLVQQQLKKQTLESAQHQKQREKLKRLREERKGKREDVAAALFTLGERQKTTLQNAKKGEQERQIAQIGERVSRAKYERTMTRMSAESPSGRGFSDQVLEEGHNAMEQKAKQLEQSFKKEEEKAMAELEASGGASAKGSSLLTEKSRMDILKERRQQKKLQKQAKQETIDAEAD